MQSVPRAYLPCCDTYLDCPNHFPTGIYHVSGLSDAPASADESCDRRESSTAQTTAAAAAGSFNRYNIDAPNTAPEGAGAKILTLPVELLELVARFLSLLDAARFALASRDLGRAVGPRAWAQLKRPENRFLRGTFLRHIQREGERFCHICEVLHPLPPPPPPATTAPTAVRSPGTDVKDVEGEKAMEEGEEPPDDAAAAAAAAAASNPNTTTTTTMTTPVVTSCTFPFGYRLTSQMAQSAIERQTKKFPHGTCPDRLSCAGIVLKGSRRIDYAYRARVVNGQLLLRLDVRVRVRDEDQDQDEGLDRISAAYGGPYVLCRHAERRWLSPRPTPSSASASASATISELPPFIRGLYMSRHPERSKTKEEEGEEPLDERHYHAAYPCAPVLPARESRKRPADRDPDRGFLASSSLYPRGPFRETWSPVFLCPLCRHAYTYVCAVDATPHAAEDDHHHENGTCTTPPPTTTTAAAAAASSSSKRRSGNSQQRQLFLRSYLNLGSGRPEDLTWRRAVDPRLRHWEDDRRCSRRAFEAPEIWSY